MLTKLKYLRFWYDSVWDGTKIDYYKLPIAVTALNKSLHYQISTANTYNNGTESVIKNEIRSLATVTSNVNNLYTNGVAPIKSIPFQKNARLGVINSNPFNSSDWNVIGDPVWSFNGSSISVNSSNSVLTNRIQLKNNYTDLLNEKITIEYTLNNLSGNGLYVGWEGVNTNNPLHYTFGLLPSNGTTYFYNNPAWSEITHTSTMPVNSGDSIRMTIEIDKNIITCQKFNLTQNLTGETVTHINNFYSNLAGAYKNLGIPSLFIVSGNITITKYLRESNDVKFANKLFVGNSLVQGYHSGTYIDTYASKLGGVINAGGSETTVEFLLKMPQILSLAPKKIYIQLLENDATLNTPNWQNNFSSIITTLQNAGIKVVCLSGVPGFAGTPTLNTYLQTNFPSLYVDITTPLSSSANVLNPLYNAGDNHLNTAGNLIVYYTITASGK
jgi:hypothetical protein